MISKLKSFSRQSSEDFSDLAKIRCKSDVEDDIVDPTKPRLQAQPLEKLQRFDVFNRLNNGENIHPNNTQPISRKTSFNKVFNATLSETVEDNRPNKQSQPLRNQRSFDDERFVSSRTPSNSIPLSSSRHHDDKASGLMQSRAQTKTMLQGNGSDMDVSTDESALEQLFSKVRHNRIDFVEDAMRSGGFNPRAVDSNGNTLLHICAQNNNRRIAALLLDSASNCEVNAANFKSHTPLDYAVKYGFHKLAGFLEARGAVSGLRRMSGVGDDLPISKPQASEQFSSRRFR